MYIAMESVYVRQKQQAWTAVLLVMGADPWNANRRKGPRSKDIRAIRAALDEPLLALIFAKSTPIPASGIRRVGAQVVELREAPLIRNPLCRRAVTLDLDVDLVALQAGGADAGGGVLRWHCEVVGRLSIFCLLGAEDLDGLVDAWEALAALHCILEVGCRGGEREESADGEDGEESHGFIWGDLIAVVSLV